MDESRRMLSGLHQVRRNGILQQYSDGSGHTQIFHRERLVVNGEAQQNILDTATQVVFIRGQTQDSHDFRSRSDVEA